MKNLKKLFVLIFISLIFISFFNYSYKQKNNFFAYAEVNYNTIINEQDFKKEHNIDWLILVNDVPIGFAGATLGEDINNPFFKDQNFIFYKKTGNSIIKTKISLFSSLENNEYKNVILAEYENELKNSNSNMFVLNNKTANNYIYIDDLLFFNKGNKIDINEKFNKNCSFFYLDDLNKKEDCAEKYSLFSKKTVIKNKLKYSSNYWLEVGCLNIKNKFELCFKNINDIDKSKYIEEISKNIMDLSKFLSLNEQTEKLKELKLSAFNILKYLRDAEINLKYKTPAIPYLTHRKLLNLENLTWRIYEIINYSNNNKLNLDETIKLLVYGIKISEKENIKELPTILTDPYIWNILLNIKLKNQYLSIINNIITEAYNEILLSLKIEEEKKVSMRLKIDINSFGKKVALKAQIKPIKSDFDLVLELYDNKLSNSDSLFLSDLFNKLENNEYIDNFCKNNSGKISVFYTNPEISTNLTFIAGKGIWDKKNRASLFFQFLKQLSLSKKCQDYKIYSDKSLFLEAQEIVTVFKNDFLQEKNEFQISNGAYKKLRLITGKYEISLFSYVSGKFIAKQEFIVYKDNKETNLSLNFK